MGPCGGSGSGSTDSLTWNPWDDMVEGKSSAVPCGVCRVREGAGMKSPGPPSAGVLLSFCRVFRMVSRPGIFSLRGKKIRKYQSPLLASSSLWQGLGYPHTQGHFKHLAKKELVTFLCGLFTLNSLESFCAVCINSRKDFTLASCLTYFPPHCLALSSGEGHLVRRVLCRCSCWLDLAVPQADRGEGGYQSQPPPLEPASPRCHPSEQAFTWAFGAHLSSDSNGQIKRIQKGSLGKEGPETGRWRRPGSPWLWDCSFGLSPRQTEEPVLTVPLSEPQRIHFSVCKMPYRQQMLFCQTNVQFILKF